MRQAFGDCVFDRDRRELTRSGSVVRGGPKLLALLELLLDAAPRAVTKDDIHKALWPGTFVSEATLTSLIAELRAAIGDDARTPTLVRTVHGYGYVFVGDITRPQRLESVLGTGSFRIILGEREIPLPRGTHILGRGADTTVCVDDPGVSRHHAQITIDARGATVQDLDSKNGTTVNGEPVQGPTPLSDGSLIVLGSTALKFRVVASLATTISQKR